MTHRTAITRATVASAVALLVALLGVFGVDVPPSVASHLVEVGAVVVPAAVGVWYARQARKAPTARPTAPAPESSPGPDATATKGGATRSDRGAIG